MPPKAPEKAPVAPAAPVVAPVVAAKASAAQELPPLAAALHGGIDSFIEPLPAGTYGTYDEYVELTHKVLAGDTPANAEPLVKGPWAKKVAYLKIDDRTVLIAALVEYANNAGFKVRRVMPLLAQANAHGNVGIASLEGVPGLKANEVYLQAWPSSEFPVHFADPGLERIRQRMAAALPG